jgi:Tat protein secretion system quality control protein TatD with DNase activity
MDDETLRDDAGDDSWQTGLFDAHCHPTDTMSSIDDIPHMKAKVLTIMATRREDQDLVESVARRFPLDDNDESKSVVPAFGWHPWFSYQIFDDRLTREKPNAIAHYRSVLTSKGKDEAFLIALPEPKSLTEFLAETEDRLRRHPFAIIGEVGLDRSFKLPKDWLPHELDSRDASLTPGSREGRSLSPYKVQLAHQKLILEAQLRLAAKLQRPASIHSVKAHGGVLEVLKSLWSGHEKMSRRQRKRESSAAAAHTAEDDEESPAHSSSPLPFPPRICMHSYSGPADFLGEYLQNTVPVDVYFSFSDVINFSGPSSGNVFDAVKAIPDSKILIESDLHCAGVEMDARLSSVFQSICDIKNWPSEKGVKILERNWRRFVFGH